MAPYIPLFFHIHCINIAYTIFSIKVLFITQPHCLNWTLACLDFMDVIMGDIPYTCVTTLCLNGTLPCVDFMGVIMGYIPYTCVTTLCLNGTLPCVDFMGVIMGIYPI